MAVKAQNGDLPNEDDKMSAKQGSSWTKRLIPVAVLVALAVMAFVLGLDEYVTFDAVKQYRGTLLNFVENSGLLAVLVFVVIYIAATAVSLPGGSFLSIIGGFLFGAWVGTAAVVVGATIGATIIFLIAKSAFGDPLRARAGPALKKMEAGFQKDAFNYLLFLRLIPAFPFFLVNLVPAFLGVALRTYVLATFIGIIPGTFVFVYAGVGLGSVIDKNEEFSASGILTTEILLALVGLAIVSVLPVAYKKIKSRKGNGNAAS